jgi:nucleotide-binding universal stress UspA family protein
LRRALEQGADDQVYFVAASGRNAGDNNDEGETMSGILCAIRGGPGSQATAAEAISLAQETRLPLHFLYVVNLDFLARTINVRTRTISEQMHMMGESILLAAQAQAEEQGVTAESVVRQGDIRQQIVEACHDLGADYLVLGRPQTQEADNVFTQAQIQELIGQLEEQTGAKVILSEAEAA